MENELGWKEAIIAVLEEARVPMHYAKIAERIYELKLKTQPTATPANTVAAVIALSFKNEGEKSPFTRTSPGNYALRSVQQQVPVIAQKELAEGESSEAAGVVNAFGMFLGAFKSILGNAKSEDIGAAAIRLAASGFC